MQKNKPSGLERVGLVVVTDGEPTVGTVEDVEGVITEVVGVTEGVVATVDLDEGSVVTGLDVEEPVVVDVEETSEAPKLLGLVAFTLQLEIGIAAEGSFIFYVSTGFTQTVI